MTQALWIIAAASLVAQAVFFVGFCFLAADLLSLTDVIAPDVRADPKRLFPFVRDTITSYQVMLWAGIIGAIACCVIYLRKVFRARWFLTGARVLGWLWFLLFPISTLVGVVLIS